MNKPANLNMPPIIATPANCNMKSWGRNSSTFYSFLLKNIQRSVLFLLHSAPSPPVPVLVHSLGLSAVPSKNPCPAKFTSMILNGFNCSVSPLCFIFFDHLMPTSFSNDRASGSFFSPSCHQIQSSGAAPGHTIAWTSPMGEAPCTYN